MVSAFRWTPDSRRYGMPTDGAEVIRYLFMTTTIVIAKVLFAGKSKTKSASLSFPFTLSSDLASVEFHKVFD